MSDKLHLYQITVSPNNVKARIALGYKGLDFERTSIDPQDRSEIVKVSGQPLTPVLVHGERVVFDSASILRYLDANFRDTPPLFSADHGTMKEIEQWERWARNSLGEPAGIVFGQVFAAQKDETAVERANQLLQELTGKIEARLEENDWLVGDAMTAADVTAAPVVGLAMLPPEAAQMNPISKFFVENHRLGEGRDRTRAWVRKVLAYDRWLMPSST